MCRPSHVPPVYEASDRFDQNPLYSFEKLGKPIPIKKTLSQLDLENIGQGYSKNQKTTPQGAINMLFTKSRDSPNYWCPPTDRSNIAYHKSPTYIHRKRSTKVKSDQVNFNHCSKVCGK